MRKILWGLSIIIAISAAIFACKKNDTSANQTNPGFDVATAKEWYYGTFKISPSFSSVNWDSPLAPKQENSTKKYPDWRKAIAYKKNNYDIVELPLFYNTTNILLPAMKDLVNTPEGNRVARSAINKLLITKKPGGDIVTRCVTITPSAAYARKNNYDISYLHPNRLPDDFDGYMTITKWDRSLVHMVKIEKGKVVKRVNILASKKEMLKRVDTYKASQRLVCPPPQWVPDMQFVCVYVPTGDAVADQQACEENGEWIDNGSFEFPDCYDDGEGGDDDDPLDNCMQYSSPEDCYCMLYGYGCGGEGGEDPEGCNMSIEDADNILANITTEDLVTTNKLCGSESSADANGKIKKSCVEKWDFLRINLVGSSFAQYTAHFPAVVWRSTQNTQWKYESINYQGTIRTGYIPPCFSLEMEVIVSDPVISGDQRTAKVPTLEYNCNLTLSCLGGTRAGHYAKTYTDGATFTAQQ